MIAKPPVTCVGHACRRVHSLLPGDAISRIVWGDASENAAGLLLINVFFPRRYFANTMPARRLTVIISGQSCQAWREDPLHTCRGDTASLFSHSIARILLGEAGAIGGGTWISVEKTRLISFADVPIQGAAFAPAGARCL